jgi:hypothetical protein
MREQRFSLAPLVPTVDVDRSGETIAAFLLGAVRRDPAV